MWLLGLAAQAGVAAIDLSRDSSAVAKTIDLDLSQGPISDLCAQTTYIGDGENAKDGYRVNLGCVEGLDPLALEISIIDGKALPVIEEPN